jgi:hypothetical protein
LGKGFGFGLDWWNPIREGEATYVDFSFYLLDFGFWDFWHMELFVDI